MNTLAREQFVQAARQHGQFVREGDATGSNAAYSQLSSALPKLRAEPDAGASFLMDLLSESDPSVVTWAALYLLPFDERASIAALEKVAESGIPRLALNAAMTLKEWRAGRLKID
ncbi:hypothetical protein [Caulobacter sp. 17J80-11]|uniref:hypothetical protein n=1 Tax=Caulobacter sp. 17J80-11 TaxID=2763502 RepID=UPI001653682B|nr:hypothetical protein [Caulobacter sp. 17J80-11]MBC6981385.1 hypothetical protein [Caulobacter sp. 17J80-11]